MKSLKKSAFDVRSFAGKDDLVCLVYEGKLLDRGIHFNVSTITEWLNPHAVGRDL